MPSSHPAGAARGTRLLTDYRTVRTHSDRIAEALGPEDQVVQSMPDASPAKWHRAHTTWFFEQFVLVPNVAGYAVFDPEFSFLFNSYYEAVGARHPRVLRGLLTRPSAERVAGFRAHVDAAMEALLPTRPDLEPLVSLGLHHEQQHQELLLTDMMHAFSCSALAPAVLPGWVEPAGTPGPTRFVEREGGIAGIGHPLADGSFEGFAFDNESPRHQVLLQPHALADRLVRNAEWLAFVDDGGYRRVGLWMADGWARAQDGGLGVAAALAPARRRRGGRWGWAARRRSTSTRRCATCRGTRRTPMHAGPGPGCPRKRSWKPRRGWRRCSATSGSGPTAPISPTRGSGRRRGRSASTTASS